MKIIELSVRDLQRCLRLETRSFASPWSEASVKAELVGGAGQLALGLEDGGFLYGQVFCRIVENELHILNISVDACRRRTGLASTLLEKLFLTAVDRGVEAAFLEVRGSNAAARGLYEEWGFTVCGTRKEYYNDTGEDALLMHCKLNKVRKPAKIADRNI